LIKPGGVIYELDEENENLEGTHSKLPALKKPIRFPKGDSDNLQKRLKRFHEKFDSET